MITALRAAATLASLPLVACSGSEPAAPAPQPETQATKAAAPAASVDRRTRLMDIIEAKLVMPPGAERLHSYARSYAFSSDPLHGGGVAKEWIVGVFVREAEPGRKWMEEAQLPLVYDGGCSVVTLLFDPATATIESIDCNGEA